MDSTTVVILFSITAISIYAFIGIMLGKAWYEANSPFTKFPHLKAIGYGIVWFWPPLRFVLWVIFIVIIWEMLKELWAAWFDWLFE